MDKNKKIGEDMQNMIRKEQATAHYPRRARIKRDQRPVDSGELLRNLVEAARKRVLPAPQDIYIG